MGLHCISTDGALTVRLCKGPCLIHLVPSVHNTDTYLGAKKVFVAIRVSPHIVTVPANLPVSTSTLCVP